MSSDTVSRSDADYAMSAPCSLTAAPVRMVLSGTSAVTAAAMPKGLYKVALVISGQGLCYTMTGAAPTAVVPTDLAAAVAGKGPQIDNGEVLYFPDSVTKFAAILSNSCTGELALTPVLA